MKILIPIDIDHERIESLVISAFEGGSNYWMTSADILFHSIPLAEDVVWWGTDGLFEKGFEFEAKFMDRHDDEGGEYTGRKIVTGADFERAFKTMADKYPKHFADIMNDDCDAITGDVFMQCVIFDEIIYG